MERRCDKCEWWHHVEDTVDYTDSDCRRYPDYMRYKSPGDWCGEFQAKDTKPNTLPSCNIRDRQAELREAEATPVMEFAPLPDSGSTLGHGNPLSPNWDGKAYTIYGPGWDDEAEATMTDAECKRVHEAVRERLKPDLTDLQAISINELLHAADMLHGKVWDEGPLLRSVEYWHKKGKPTVNGKTRPKPSEAVDERVRAIDEVLEAADGFNASDHSHYLLIEALKAWCWKGKPRAADLVRKPKADVNQDPHSNNGHDTNQ